MLLSNAFSLQMLDLNKPGRISVEPITVEQAVTIFREQGLESSVGHADAAARLSSILGLEVPMDRKSTRLASGQSVIVAQITGGRLPEDTVTVPDGYAIKFLLVTVY